MSLLMVATGGVAVAQPAPDQPPVPEQPEPESPEQPPAKVIKTRGRVIDALGKPVRGATVTVEGSETTVRTGRDGWFEIDAPEGSSLVVESKAFGVGLATVTGPLLEETVLLSEEQLAETITIESDAPAAAPGAAQLDRQELQRVPGTGGDVVRALTVMPGVVNLQVPLGMSGVVIRGSSPQDSRVLIDDFEVPVLFHNIGFRAIVPAETIASLDFIPGGFDVAYGRATSGIVLLRTRSGSEERSTQAELSVIDGGLLAQGSFGKKSRYMFALRRSTIDFVLPSVIPESVDLSLTTVPRYWDGQFRLDHELSNRWTLTLSGVGTDDTFELVATKNEDVESKRFYNRTRFARFTANARFKEGPWQANLNLSALLPQFTFELGLFQKIDVKQPTVTPRFEVTRTEPTALGLKNVEWRVGGEVQAGRSSLEIALPMEPREGDVQMGFDPEDVSNAFKGTVWLPDFAAWTALSADLDPKIRVTVGLRGEIFARPGEWALQPRGELQYKLSNAWKLRLSAGAFRRPPEFQSEVLSETARSERSTQTIAGLQYEPVPGARLQTSIYYTDRTALLRNNAMGELENSGRGRTYGGEVLGTYRGGPWFAWLTYTYSRSERTDEPGEEPRLFSYDQPHNMNAALSWRSGRWQLGGRFQLYSGLPYTPILGGILDSDRNIYIPIPGEVNSERAPIHHQLDVRVDYSWKWGPVQATAFLDIQNIYANDSIVTYFYSYDFLQRSAFRSLPILPSIGIRGIL